jgi:hypothetical protein
VSGMDLCVRIEGGAFSLMGELLLETGVRGMGGAGGDGEVGSEDRRGLSGAKVYEVLMSMPPRGCCSGGEKAGFGGLSSDADTGDVPRDDMVWRCRCECESESVSEFASVTIKSDRERRWWMSRCLETARQMTWTWVSTVLKSRIGRRASLSPRRRGQ